MEEDGYGLTGEDTFLTFMGKRRVSFFSHAVSRWVHQQQQQQQKQSACESEAKLPLLADPRCGGVEIDRLHEPWFGGPALPWSLRDLAVVVRRGVEIRCQSLSSPTGQYGAACPVLFCSVLSCPILDCLQLS